MMTTFMEEFRETREQYKQQFQQLTQINSTLQEENNNMKKELIAKLDAIINMMTTFMEEFRETREQYKQQFQQLTQINSTLQEENNNMKKELIDLKQRIDKIEQEKRRNNLIVTGMKLKHHGNPKEEIENFVKTHLKLDIKMKKAYAIGERA
ncbi:hypothetical protein QE152_g31227 [Popillia japonica]|uniref:Uncharacterized protein n=1 Tax=Popillia japonica TaxID=7064 RepID=A0AAW1JCA3_POPJA